MVKIIKEQQNPNNTHNFSANKLIIEINKLLKKNNIELKYKGEIKKFNMTHFILMCKYYGIKNNPQLCFEYGIHQQPSYSYSYKAIEFVFNELKKDPEHIIENIINKNKKSWPQEQRNSKVIKTLLPFGNPALILHKSTFTTIM